MAFRTPRLPASYAQFATRPHHIEPPHQEGRERPAGNIIDDLSAAREGTSAIPRSEVFVTNTDATTAPAEPNAPMEGTPSQFMDAYFGSIRDQHDQEHDHGNMRITPTYKGGSVAVASARVPRKPAAGRKLAGGTTSRVKKPVTPKPGYAAKSF
jgi:hypothetical protein